MEPRPLPRWILVALLSAVALVVLGIGGVLALQAADRQGDLPVLAAMPDFHLTDQDGREVSAADVTGKVLLVGFIYTSCEDICPVLTAQMRSLQQELSRTGLLGEAQLLSISVDPSYDTPERLTAYARQYRADLSSWRFLTGDEQHVRKVVVDGFLLGMERIPASHEGHHHGAGAAPDYRVEHSGRIALVDRNGQIRAYYDGLALDDEQVVEQVRRLVRER